MVRLSHNNAFNVNEIIGNIYKINIYTTWDIMHDEQGQTLGLYICII